MNLRIISSASYSVRSLKNLSARFLPFSYASLISLSIVVSCSSCLFISANCLLTDASCLLLSPILLKLGRINTNMPTPIIAATKNTTIRIRSCLLIFMLCMSFPRYCAVDSAVDSVAEAVEDVSVCVPFLPASIILLAEFLSTVTPLPALRSIVRLNSMVSLLSSPFSTV